MTRNINCKKCDRNGRCHHPEIPDDKLLWFKSRPFCRLFVEPKMIIDKNGNVSYDDKCKYQEEYPRPERIKRS